jgi:hypothetical protein
MAEREVRYSTVTDRPRITEHAGFAVGLKGRVRSIERRDDLRNCGRAILGGQQDARRPRILKLDEVRLILGFERGADTAGERVSRIAQKLPRRA